MKVCSVDRCNQAARARGWCMKHWKRWRKYGSPLYVTPQHLYKPKPRTPPIERFWMKVDKDGPNGCWLWTSDHSRGYGRMWLNDGGRRQVSAHRFIYEYVNGPIPEGYQLDHFVCDNGPGGCVNPDHMRAVTPRENTLRSGNPAALNLAKTQCLRGHPFDETNTILSSDGARRCKACRAAMLRRKRSVRVLQRPYDHERDK